MSPLALAAVLLTLPAAPGNEPLSTGALDDAYRLKALEEQVQIRMATGNVINSLIEMFEDAENPLPVMPHGSARLRAERAALVLEVDALAEQQQPLLAAAASFPHALTWSLKTPSELITRAHGAKGSASDAVRAELARLEGLESRLRDRRELLKLCDASLKEAILDLPTGGSVGDVLDAAQMAQAQESSAIDEELEHQLSLITLQALLGVRAPPDEAGSDSQAWQETSSALPRVPPVAARGR